MWTQYRHSYVRLFYDHKFETRLEEKQTQMLKEVEQKHGQNYAFTASWIVLLWLTNCSFVASRKSPKKCSFTYSSCLLAGEKDRCQGLTFVSRLTFSGTNWSFFDGIHLRLLRLRLRRLPNMNGSASATVTRKSNNISNKRNIAKVFLSMASGLKKMK